MCNGVWPHDISSYKIMSNGFCRCLAFVVAYVCLLVLLGFLVGCSASRVQPANDFTTHGRVMSIDSTHVTLTDTTKHHYSLQYDTIGRLISLDLATTRHGSKSSKNNVIHDTITKEIATQYQFNCNSQTKQLLFGILFFCIIILFAILIFAHFSRRR